MGNASTCCLPNKSDDDPNERTHILDNPVGSPEGFGDSRYGRASVSSPTYGALNGRNEQSQLNHTLHKLSAKVIDVSSIDNHLEQTDFNDRQRLYAQRVAAIKRPLSLRSRFTAAALSAPINRNLTLEPISGEDVALINYFSERTSQALANGFQIHCEESFVVQFDP